MRPLPIRRFLQLALGIVAVVGTQACRERARSETHPAPLGSLPLASSATYPPPKTAEAPAAEGLGFIEVMTGGADPASAQPWIVALHGLGDRPETFQRLFRDAPFAARVYVVRAPRPYGPGFDWLGVRVDGPAEQLAAAVARSAAAVAALTASLAQEPRNLGKPIVTGFSQGGYLSFALAALHPAQLRAALPIAGGLPVSLWPRTQGEGRPALIAFHGTADAVVPHAPAHEALRAFEVQHYAVAWHEYPDLGHQISPELYRDWERALAEQVASARAAKP